MRVKEKCDLTSMRFCAPMLARVMGKFSDGTFQVVSKIDPASGDERHAHEIVLRHEGPAFEVPDLGLVERMVARFSGSRLRRRPFPLRLNWCPWCGASLAERDRTQASADPTERTLEVPPYLIQPGPYLFEFSSYEDWCDHAQSRFKGAGVDSTSTLCLDRLGRTCWCGKDFMQAHDDQSFPVKVFSLRR